MVVIGSSVPVLGVPPSFVHVKGRLAPFARSATCAVCTSTTTYEARGEVA